jgi:hypothetical protein
MSLQILTGTFMDLRTINIDCSLSCIEYVTLR